ncbi:PAS-domain containing protein [Pseudogulbenkiania ferrooxidans]|nr:PAS-domain containing protein [Pseudogulbenkiania ferrooxidans]
MDSGKSTPVADEEGFSAALERHELLYAGLDLIDQGLTVFDANLRLVAWNQAFLDLLDFPDDLARIGTPFEAFIRHNAERGEYGPGDIEQQIAERVEVARQFLPHTLERVRPDGQVLKVHGVPLPGKGFITIYTDITTQRNYERLIENENAELDRRVRERTAELEGANAGLRKAKANLDLVAADLRLSEARLRLITDTVPAFIAYIDRHLVYRFANKGYADWTGRTKDTVIGQTVETVMGDELFQTLLPHLRKAQAGQQVGYEYSRVRADGRTVYARSTLVPEIGADGQVMGFFSLSLDVTEQVLAQNALLRAQKMEAVGELAGGLAHDFNNLLTVVLGNLAALQEKHAHATALMEYVDPAIQAARRGVEVIRQLLTFSRQQPLEPQSIEVGRLVLNLTRLLRSSLPSTITITTQLPEEALYAFADPHQLENALLNLAFNARDAMPEGGQLRIEIAPQTIRETTGGERQAAPGDYVRITVHDNGCGMDGATLARAFEPFFTTKRFDGGSGLGLSMVYGFVEQSHGMVHIESALGAGTAVILCLPAGSPTPASERSPACPAICSASGELVLLVEDEAEVRKIIRMQLVDLGYAVLEADNGVEALAMIEQVEEIACVISDVVMPGGVSGWQLAERARRLRPGLHVVLISGNAQDSAAGLAAELGIDPLYKPFSKEQLALAIHPGP